MNETSNTQPNPHPLFKVALEHRELSGRYADVLFETPDLTPEQVESLSARAAYLAAEALSLDFWRKRIEESNRDSL